MKEREEEPKSHFLLSMDLWGWTCSKEGPQDPLGHRADPPKGSPAQMADFIWSIFLGEDDINASPSSSLEQFSVIFHCQRGPGHNLGKKKRAGNEKSVFLTDKRNLRCWVFPTSSRVRVSAMLTVE